MTEAIGRPRVARVYALVISLASLTVVLQGFLFAGFYWKFNQGWLDWHRLIGDSSLTVALIVLPILAYAARFPGRLKMVPLTWVLTVLWIVQWALGNWTEDARWLSILHIPNAFLVFGYTVFLTGKVHRVVWRK